MGTQIIKEQLNAIAMCIAPANYLELGAKLGRRSEELEKILDSKDQDYLKSTEAILMSWWAAEKPGETLRAKGDILGEILSSLGIKIPDTLLLAGEQQEQQPEQQQEQQHSAESTSQDNLSSMNNSEADSAVHSLHSRTNSSLQRNEDASRTIESTQGSVPLYQASNREPKFFDIYLDSNGRPDTVHVQKVKNIIHGNRWTMMTSDDKRLGVSKINSIEEALKTCSHVVLILTKEDCEKDDTYQTMTRGMAFQSTVGGTFNCRVISIRCCEESHLPLSLQSLENAWINDPLLEDKLKKTIDVSIRKKKEGSLVGTSSTLPTEGSIAPLVTSDLGAQPLTAAQVASEVEQIVPRINNLPAGQSDDCVDVLDAFQDDGASVESNNLQPADD